MRSVPGADVVDRPTAWQEERNTMICRIWHGWTSPANADAYEQLLRSEIFHGIAARGIAGYRGIELLRRPAADSVEFVTLMWFDSVDAIRAFAGAEYEVAVVPAAARALLERFDARSSHYEVRQARGAGCRPPLRTGGDAGHPPAGNPSPCDLRSLSPQSEP